MSTRSIDLLEVVWPTLRREPAAAPTDVLSVETPAERLARRLPLPFPAAAALLAFLATFPTISYVMPWSREAILTTFFNPDMGTVQGAHDVLMKGALFAVLAFLIWAPRSMRSKVAQTQESLQDACGDCESVFDSAFRSAVRWEPAAALTAVVLAANVVLFLAQGGRVTPGTVTVFVLDLVTVGARWMVIFTFFWFYIASIRGLAALGSDVRQVAPYYVDDMLGMRPLGSLSLSLASTYFLALGLGGFWATLSSHNVATQGALAIFFVTGIVLFFAPMRVLHARMVAEKKRAQVELRERYATLFEAPRRVTAGRREAERASLDDLRDAIGYEVTERQVMAIKTWPFDTSLITKLATSLALPILLTLVGRQLILLILRV
jgi:hypothetical protein